MGSSFGGVDDGMFLQLDGWLVGWLVVWLVVYSNNSMTERLDE
jgi:hypothetical protein